MEILGKVGIDIKLLIAQIINFGLFLWLLKKFLYAPIIRRIEKDERELSEAKIQKEKLEKERAQFQEQKTKELAEARRKAEDIIAEAHHVAEKIEKEAKEKMEKETRAAISQSKEHLKTLEPAFKTQVKQSARKEIIQELRQYFLNLPQQAQKGLQEFFWQNLLKQVEKLALTHLQTTDIVTVLKEIEKKYENKKTKDGFEKEMAQALSKKLGPIVLEHVHPIEKTHLTDLESLLSKKIGVKIILANRLNKDLISGFRLEVAGIIVESNLLDQINNEKTSTT